MGFKQSVALAASIAVFASSLLLTFTLDANTSSVNESLYSINEYKESTNGEIPSVDEVISFLEEIAKDKSTEGTPDRVVRHAIDYVAEARKDDLPLELFGEFILYNSRDNDFARNGEIKHYDHIQTEFWVHRYFREYGERGLKVMLDQFYKGHSDLSSDHGLYIEDLRIRIVKPTMFHMGFDEGSLLNKIFKYIEDQPELRKKVLKKYFLNDIKRFFPKNYHDEIELFRSHDLENLESYSNAFKEISSVAAEVKDRLPSANGTSNRMGSQDTDIASDAGKSIPDSKSLAAKHKYWVYALAIITLGFLLYFLSRRRYH